MHAILAVNCSHDLETGMIHHFANGLVIVELRMNCHLRRMRALLFDPPKRTTGADLLRRRGNRRRPEERPGEKGRALFWFLKIFPHCKKHPENVLTFW